MKDEFREGGHEVYISICSRAGTSPAKDNFCTCFPDIGTIAQKFKHSRMTIIEATPWLEAKAYLFKERRQRASNQYTIILKRDWFLGIRLAEGDDAAREQYKAWIREQQAIARGKQPDETSGAVSSDRKTHESSDDDFKNDRGGLEVSATEPLNPSEKSYPLHLDLDPHKTVTREKRSGDLEPELPLGPFLRRRIFD